MPMDDWEKYRAAEKRLGDWNLVSAFENNEDVELKIEDIDKVVAVHEGERDGNIWIWLVKLCSKEYALLEGWCDYTGWD